MCTQIARRKPSQASATMPTTNAMNRNSATTIESGAEPRIAITEVELVGAGSMGATKTVLVEHLE